MGKGEPRHNPEKPQNNYGEWCQYCDDINGNLYCEQLWGDASTCKGNLHNCVKSKYHNLACRSDKQKNNDVYRVK